MSKPTIDEMDFGIYLIGCLINGKCVYCRLDMSGAKGEVKERHYKTEHSK